MIPNRLKRGSAEVSASVAPRSIVQVYVSPNDDFLQPPAPSSLQPVLEIVDLNGVRYQTCADYEVSSSTVVNLPCVNGLPGNSFHQQDYCAFQVPVAGTNPATFYRRVSDGRGAARPDFVYTFSLYGVKRRTPLPQLPCVFPFRHRKGE